MSDGAFPDRLTQLRARWESDPSSRIFLQLAEEYRHQGRVREALEVLERGLKEHPGYLSALVAKGRCLLELGEPERSREVLERVVKQDATQMVANKLLVRAYLETGEPAKARERLDLYSLLNDSDPEIEELRRRIKSMDRPAPAAEPQRTEADPFALEPPAPRRDVAADVFAIDLAPVVAPAPAPAPVVAAPARGEAVEEPGGLLFPGLASADRRQRYLDGLAAEGLFSGAVPLPAPVAAPVAEDSSWLEEESATSYALTPLEPEEAEPAAPPPAAEEDLWAEEPPPSPWSPAPPAPVLPPAPEPVAAEPQPELATATLGQLYLRQGHRAEAERIFREVLAREPESPAARAGLAQLAVQAPAEPARRAVRPLAARELLAGFTPAPAQTGGAGVTARKVFLLRRYLERLRKGARDVS